MNGGCGVIGDQWLAEDCENLHGYMCRYTEGNECQCTMKQVHHLG